MAGAGQPRVEAHGGACTGAGDPHADHAPGGPGDGHDGRVLVAAGVDVGRAGPAAGVLVRGGADDQVVEAVTVDVSRSGDRLSEVVPCCAIRGPHPGLAVRVQALRAAMVEQGSTRADAVCVVFAVVTDNHVPIAIAVHVSDPGHRVAKLLAQGCVGCSDLLFGVDVDARCASVVHVRGATPRRVGVTVGPGHDVVVAIAVQVPGPGDGEPQAIVGRAVRGGELVLAGQVDARGTPVVGVERALVAPGDVIAVGTDHHVVVAISVQVPGGRHGGSEAILGGPV